MKNLQPGQTVYVQYRNQKTWAYIATIRTYKYNSDYYDLDLQTRPWGTAFMIPHEIVYPLQGGNNEKEKGSVDTGNASS